MGNYFEDNSFDYEEFTDTQDEEFEIAIDSTTTDNSSLECNCNYTSDDYCRSQCEFFNQCYANHEFCIMQAFDNVLSTLTPREEEVIRNLYKIGAKKEYTLTELSNEFGISNERIKQIRNKGLNKLRHPSRSKALSIHLFAVYINSTTSPYSNLLNTIFGEPSKEMLFDLSMGIDPTIVYKQDHMHRSASEIKSGLSRNITDFPELQPFYTCLCNIGITTLDHLLHTSKTRLLLTAFNQQDDLYFDLIKVLTSMGYRIKGTNTVWVYDSTFDPIFIEELETVAVNTSIYKKTLDDLPLGIAIILFENGISTVGGLLKRINYIEESDALTSGMKKVINDFLIAENLVYIFNGRKFYITTRFVNIYLKSLICWLRENSHSVFKLKYRLEQTNCKLTNSLLQTVDQLYPDFTNTFFKSTDSKKALELAIEVANFSVRTFNCLTIAGIDTLGELASKTLDDLKKIRNLGKFSIDEIQETLAFFGLKLSD